MRTADERDLSLLDPVMLDKVNQAIKICASQGVTITAYCAMRDPWTQARLYRRSRSTAKVMAMVAKLEQGGAPFLASVLEGVGPQRTGPWATNAVPGMSWHQWGEAVDAAPVVNGEIPWNDATQFHPWREACVSVGLHAPIAHDWPHVQLRAAGSPLSAGMTWAMVDQAMRERWG